MKEKADEYRAILTAIKNTIEGYGDEWLKPTYSLLDELAEDLSYSDAGQKLKEARAHSVEMVKNRRAAECDYVQYSRRSTAINFVVDAFNGKVDSILSKTKKDNYGNNIATMGTSQIAPTCMELLFWCPSWTRVISRELEF